MPTVYDKEPANGIDLFKTALAEKCRDPNFNINSVIDTLGYSRDYFRKLFLKATGVSPSVYLVKKRLEYAVGLLDTSDSRPLISDVAQQSGFDDYQYFCRVFKKYYNITPGNYSYMRYMTRKKIVYSQRSANDIYSAGRKLNSGTFIPKIKPLRRQLEFLDWEFGIYLHFGLRTFYPDFYDWDNREMPLDAFEPKNIDCDKWASQIKAAGAKYAVLVVMHHDGFACWQTDTTEYSIKNTPYKNGGGDIVREFTDACRKVGLKIGLSYSPTTVRKKKNTAQTSYSSHICRQLKELLSNYGKIDYLSVNGCGTNEGDFDDAMITSEIRSCNPEIILFNLWDPDTRWIGLDNGIAPSPYFNTVKQSKANADDGYYTDIYRFLPAECDLRLRNTWFSVDGDEKLLYTREELLGLYEMSVGHGCNFLVNIGPDKNGELPDADYNLVKSMADELKRYESCLADDFGELFRDAKGDYAVYSKTPVAINRLVIKEDISDGESVEYFRVKSDSTIIYTGYNIGHKCICTFPTVKTKMIEVEILASNGSAVIKSIRAYNTNLREK